MRRVLVAALAASALGLATPAAAAVTFTGSSGSYAASASFDKDVNGHLIVTLTNTSTADIAVPGDILHALFFNILNENNPTLTYSDADICGSCSFVGTVTGTGSDVGAEWAYKRTVGGLGAGTGGNVSQTYGLSSAGYGIFGPGDTLQGVAGHPDRGGNSQPPGGGDFGLLSAGYVGPGNGGVQNNSPYIKNSVIFDLGAFGGSLSDISNIRFQYGTGLDGLTFNGNTPPAVPEPATWGMMLLGFGGIGMAMRRGRKSAKKLAQVA